MDSSRNSQRLSKDTVLQQIDIIQLDIRWFVKTVLYQMVGFHNSEDEEDAIVLYILIVFIILFYINFYSRTT